MVLERAMTTNEVVLGCAFAFEDCLRRGDLVLTSCIEACRRRGGELPATAFHTRLNVDVTVCDDHRPA